MVAWSVSTPEKISQNLYKRSSLLCFPLPTPLSAHTMAGRKPPKKSTVTTNPTSPKAPRCRPKPRPTIKIPASHLPSAETTNENPPTNLNPLEESGRPLPVPAQEERAPPQPSAMTNLNPQSTSMQTPPGSTQMPPGSMQAPPGSTEAPPPARAQQLTTATPATTALAQEDSAIAAQLAIALGKCISFSGVYN